MQGAAGVGQAVASVDGIAYTSLTAALTNLQDGQTVKILSSTQVNLADTYTLAAKNVTLDLNGQTVTMISSADSNSIQITGGLTIADSSETADGALHITSTSNSMGNGIFVADGGSLHVTGGTVSYATEGSSSSAIRTAGQGTFAMSGGTVKISGATAYGVFLGGTALSKITGGKIDFDPNTTAPTVYGVYASSYFASGEGCEIHNLTVDASTVPHTKIVVCVGSYSDATPLFISGGVYKANGHANSYAVGQGFSNKTSISGGSFVGQVKAANGKITGGTFSVLPSSQYLPDGKIFQKQSDGYFYVVDGSYVATMDGIGYTDWDELFANASTGTTASIVYITSDTAEIVVPAEKNVSLWNDENHTIGRIVNNGTCRVAMYAMPGVQVENNGTFYLDHEVGTVVNNAGAAMTASAAAAKVTGTITNHGTMTLSQGNYLGAVTSDTRANITGGTFAEDVKEICAEGYTTQQNHAGTWDVVVDAPHVAEINGYWYSSLADALEAVQDGETVKLLTDTALGSQVSIRSKNFTLDMNGCTVTYTAEGKDFGEILLLGSSDVTITGDGTFTYDDSYTAADAKSNGRMFEVQNSSILTIENGTYEAWITAILVDNQAEVIIKDGTFSAAELYNGKNFLLDIQDPVGGGTQSATFRVFGGTFVDFDPANAGVEADASKNNFCAPGYTATQVNTSDGKSVYVAAPKEDAPFVAAVDGLYYLQFADAVKALKSGSTMTLLEKYTGDPITISGPVTIDLGTTGTDAALFRFDETNYQVVQDGNKLIFSPKTFIVTFETNGGSQVASQTVIHDTAATEPAAPTKEGYRFDGWYSDSALTQTYDFSAIVTGNITLYAKWTLIPTPTPEQTPTPDDTNQSGTTSQPQTNTQPAVTAYPAVTTPAATPAQPSRTARPASTVQPSATAQPEAAETPAEATATPAPAEPTPTATPEAVAANSDGMTLPVIPLVIVGILLLLLILLLYKRRKKEEEDVSHR